MRGSSLSGGVRAPLARAGVLYALLAGGLAACQADSLYDAEDPGADVPPPAVAIISPEAGAQLTAGRPVEVIIMAADTLGVSEIELSFRGVTTGTIEFTFVPPQDTVVVDTTIVLPAGSAGTLELLAAARNGLGGIGRTSAIALPVALRDSITPDVRVTAEAAPRLELTDSIRATITGRDNTGGSGIARLGLTVLVTYPNRPDTQAVQRVFDIAPPAVSAVSRDVALPPPFVTERDLPVAMNLSFHAFAIDSAGNCAAAVPGSTGRFSCATLQAGGAEVTVAAAATDPIPVTAVSGRSVPLPQGAVVPDLLADVPRSRLYLSNMASSQVEVLHLASLSFGNSVRVGSQPWGLALSRNTDSLIVANSGGTSLSYVSLAAANPVEIVSQRVHTPNTNLFEIKFSRDNNGVQRLDVNFFDFSDRPQYVAQDAFGRLLYSTLPTDAAPNGTMRVATREPGWAAPEVRLLLGRNLVEPDSFTISVQNVDSMRVFTSTTGDQIEIYDHRAGFPGQLISSGIAPLAVALDALTANPESDIRWFAGRWDLTLIGLSDTTYVAASGDRRRVAFGEGARGSGRIFMWHAELAEISNEITVADLVGNTAEYIVGIDLNQDGSLNTARGLQAAYYFKDDLRLQGHFAAAAPVQGSGAGLHPDHPSYVNFPPSGPNTLGFVAAGTSVKIVDTVHFFERGEIAIRDNIVGPLEVSRALPGDNTGCSGADCIVARVYGVTDGGAVVIVPVRGRDIQ